MGELVNQNVAIVGCAGVYNGKKYDLELDSSQNLLVAVDSSTPVSVTEKPTVGIPGGSVTLSGSAEDLGLGGATPAQWVWLYPDSGNAATATWGDVNNSASPIPDSGISFPIDDADKVYINGTAADVVYYRYGTTS